ncbi:MAG TPA: xanthine dehydrogenase family protein molybdopterin-binding subunit [Conexibacter sp.]|jgi:2-furoyl-CoA dehydrogenase large subunit
MSVQDAPVATRGTVGTSVKRFEDKRLLQGQGTYSDDVEMRRMGYVHFVRSPHAHARIVSIDVSAAEAMEGVYGTLTGAEVDALCEPFTQLAPDPGSRMEDYALAVGKVRFASQPVVAVLAETRELARDAAEAVVVDYELLPASIDSLRTLDPDAPLLHEPIGSNVAYSDTYEWGDIDWALENADHVVSIDKLHFHRFSSTPLECNAAVVNWDLGTDVIEVRSNNQMPQFAAMFIGPAIGVPVSKMRFVSQDIGGAFGLKITSYPTIAACILLSRKAGRPVKWTEYRSENVGSSAHGNERTFTGIRVAVMADGTILGFDVKAFDDAGAFLRYEPLGGVIWSQVAPGCYKLKHLRVEYTQVLTNKCPVGPNRGYSRLQHLWMIERIVDVVAHELGFDPVALRKHNYPQPEDYPYETPNGCVYDSGDLPRMLDIALELLDYDGWRERQEELRAEGGGGKRIGIGIGTTLDSGTNNFGQAQIMNPHLPFSGNGEAAHVKLDLYGEVSVNLGTSPQGQGHETTAAQTVADVLGVDPATVHVHAGYDTANHAYVGFSGTYASQFAVTGLGAALGAAQKLLGEIKLVAATALGAEVDEIEVADGMARVRGDEEREIPFIGVANLVYANVAALPDEVIDQVSLNCRYVYRPPFDAPDTVRKFGNLTLTYAAQLHAAVVEIDEATGHTEILRYVAVDDCGRRINPNIVEGQVHGAAAHGIGAALHESFVYDEDSGQLLSHNFYDYHAATALDVPLVVTAEIESPSPFSPNGAKGMGEGGGAPLSTISAAIQDALGGRGATVTDSHNPSERVWRLLREGSDAPRHVEVTSR